MSATRDSARSITGALGTGQERGEGGQEPTATGVGAKLGPALPWVPCLLWGPAHRIYLLGAGPPLGPLQAGGLPILQPEGGAPQWSIKGGRGWGTELVQGSTNKGLGPLRIPSFRDRTYQTSLVIGGTAFRRDYIRWVGPFKAPPRGVASPWHSGILSPLCPRTGAFWGPKAWLSAFLQALSRESRDSPAVSLKPQPSASSPLTGQELECL